MHHCKLLIIDDDPLWLRAAERYFSFYYKYEVYTANSCALGLKVFESKRPDCVLLDYNLLGESADVLCKKIRSTEKLLHTPIVIISGDITRDEVAYTVCQADAFLMKGSFDKARAVIEMIMRRINWERGVMSIGDVRLTKERFSVYCNCKLVANLSPEQFCLFSLLICEGNKFVNEGIIAVHVFGSDFSPDKSEAIKAMVYRLRQKLGRRLGRRIKSKRDHGWIYVQPRRYYRKCAHFSKEIEAV